MYCKNCGNEIDEDAIFCSKCGERINNQGDNSFSKNIEKKGKEIGQSIKSSVMEIASMFTSKDETIKENVLKVKNDLLKIEEKYSILIYIDPNEDQSIYKFNIDNTVIENLAKTLVKSEVLVGFAHSKPKGNNYNDINEFYFLTNKRILSFQKQFFTSKIVLNKDLDLITAAEFIYEKSTIIIHSSNKTKIVLARNFAEAFYDDLISLIRK